MTIYQLQTVYVCLGLLVEFIGFGMTAYALKLALTHRRKALTAWLVPSVVGQIGTIGYSLWTLLFRWLGLRTTPASTLTAVIWGGIDGLIALYAISRLVMFVRVYCREAGANHGAV